MSKRPQRAKQDRAAAADAALGNPATTAPDDARPAANGASALTLNVSTLLQEPLGSRRSYPVRDGIFIVDDEDVEISGEVELLRTDGSILATATLDLSVREVCDSCLEPFRQPLHLALREEFWPAADPITHEPIEVPEEREGFPVVEGHIDLHEPIRQYVEMARSMRAHCGAGCPGPPAAASGSVQDREAPDHAEAPTDSRWAALQALRDELSSLSDEDD